VYNTTQNNTDGSKVWYVNAINHTTHCNTFRLFVVPVSTHTLGTRHFNSFQEVTCFQDVLKLGLVVSCGKRCFALTSKSWYLFVT